MRAEDLSEVIVGSLASNACQSALRPEGTFDSLVAMRCVEERVGCCSSIASSVHFLRQNSHAEFFLSCRAQMSNRSGSQMHGLLAQRSQREIQVLKARKAQPHRNHRNHLNLTRFRPRQQMMLDDLFHTRSLFGLANPTLLQQFPLIIGEGSVPCTIGP